MTALCMSVPPTFYEVVVVATPHAMTAANEDDYEGF